MTISSSLCKNTLPSLWLACNLWGDTIKKYGMLHRFTLSVCRGHANLSDILPVLLCAMEASADLGFMHIDVPSLTPAPPPAPGVCWLSLEYPPNVLVSLVVVFFPYPCLSCVFLCSGFSINRIPSAFYFIGIHVSSALLVALFIAFLGFYGFHVEAWNTYSKDP